MNEWIFRFLFSSMNIKTTSENTQNHTNNLPLWLKHISFSLTDGPSCPMTVRVCRTNCPGLIYWANCCHLNDAPVTFEWNIIIIKIYIYIYTLVWALRCQRELIKCHESRGRQTSRPAHMQRRRSSFITPPWHLFISIWLYLFCFILNPLFLFYFLTDMFNWDTEAQRLRLLPGQSAAQWVAG